MTAIGVACPECGERILVYVQCDCKCCRHKRYSTRTGVEMTTDKEYGERVMIREKYAIRCVEAILNTSTE